MRIFLAGRTKKYWMTSSGSGREGVDRHENQAKLRKTDAEYRPGRWVFRLRWNFRRFPKESAAGEKSVNRAHEILDGLRFQDIALGARIARFASESS